MSKTFTLEDLSKHNNDKSCYLLIKGKVYDVTKFLEEHPGGEEVVLDSAGGDATEAYEDVGHSADATEMLTKYIAGDLAESEKAKLEELAKEAKAKAAQAGGPWLPALLVGAVIAAAAVAYTQMAH